MFKPWGVTPDRQAQLTSTEPRIDIQPALRDIQVIEGSFFVALNGELTRLFDCQV